MSTKFAWSWRVKEECLAEYVQMHADPWPEVLEEHRKAGIRNYSIFQEGTTFFYCFECDDVEGAFAYIAQSEVCGRWNALTSGMMQVSFDMAEAEPIRPMREIFYLR
ncbi:L-rhamnose mutarotase [Paenibacillus harenae]|uniref:L-rhamnose mutarotase n=1 Tax=Paenibacillus harenae TaxID=306543 RepID=UPI0004920D18|nr:L-rhamnose mutarotase [Paenibacillus harenae]